MKEARSCPQERGHVRSEWLKGAAIALVLGIILAGCAPSVRQGDTEPTPTGQPTMMPATPIMGAQAPTLGMSPTPYAEPKELPTKGSPEAKVTLTLFCEFI